MFYVLAVFFIVLDRLAKTLAWQTWRLQSLTLTPWLKLDYKKNFGLAFSLPLGGWPINLLIILAILILSAVLVYQYKKNNQHRVGCLLLIILGAASNLLDRFKYGGVIDYLDLSFFTVFNLADCLIVAGVIGLLVMRRPPFAKATEGKPAQW